jgi:hypothetical protein
MFEEDSNEDGARTNHQGKEKRIAAGGVAHNLP